MKMCYIGKDVSLRSVKMFDVSVDVLCWEDILLTLVKIGKVNEVLQE